MTSNSSFIFDFDGTIADTWKLAPMAISTFGPKFGVNINNKKEIEDLRYLSIREILKKYNISLIKLISHWKEFTDYFYEQIKNTNAIPGIKVALDKLSHKKVRMFVLSSNSKRNIEAFFVNHNLLIFEKIYSQYHLFGKSGSIKQIISENKLDLNHTYYVGDESRDIEAAKKAQVKSVAVTWGYNKKTLLEKYLPDFLIDSPNQLVTEVLGT